MTLCSRGCALWVLSSIRVSVIVPIMLLAIKESDVDMSPFISKTAAHSIPKLNSLEPEMKEKLIAVLKKLLADRTPLVIGSAVMTTIREGWCISFQTETLLWCRRVHWR